MRIRSLFLLIVLLLVAGFLALNWQAITVPVKFSLLLTTIDVPVGLVMVVVLVLVVASFGGYLLWSQAETLSATRRHAAELRAQRTLAEQAESSRLSELRALIHGEFAQFGARMAHSEELLRTEIRDQGNAIAASIGELDDRLHRTGGDLP